MQKVEEGEVESEPPIDEAAAAEEAQRHALEATGLPAISEKMQLLTQSILDEYERLTKAWTDLITKQAEIDAIRARITSVPVKEGDRVKLNVGGERFEARATNLVKNTYFRALISLTFTEMDSDGFHFIDRNPEWFHVVVNYLRDGSIDLSRIEEYALGSIRKEAEFYMVPELVNEIDKYRSSKRGGEGTIVLSVNTSRAPSVAFNGIFFEVTVLRRDFKIHGISFIAAERRTIRAEVHFREGGLDSPNPFRKIGDAEAQAERGQPIPFHMTSLALPGGTYTIGVFSADGGISVCPKKESVRQMSGLTFGRSYHVTGNQITKRAAEDAYDFSGELLVSFQ